MLAIRNTEKPFEKKEKNCCCVVFALRAKTTQQQLIPLIIRIAGTIMNSFHISIYCLFHR